MDYPKIVEVMQWTGHNIIELSKFCDRCWIDHYQRLFVRTNQGPICVQVGDCIAKREDGSYCMLVEFFE